MYNCITTYTGKHFQPMDPDPNLICIEDIAHALSLTCRGNGHMKTFWSVGEHCICCAKEAELRGYPPRLILACLIHDATECYLSDIPSPFKQELPDYIRHEDRLMDMICRKFLGSVLSSEEHRKMKEIDKNLLKYDLTYLLNEKQEGGLPPLLINLDYSFRPFEEVEKEYLDIFYRYYEG